ncbi:MAG: hypothetical protein D6784_15115 [Chloroflexi bacterium]|nr:MAG: hypothetical protein D6784_15115 [Chloroflexota bacterium]
MPQDNTQNMPDLHQTYLVLLNRVCRIHHRFGDQFPTIGEQHTYRRTENNNWMAAFWPGILWLTWAATSDDEIRRHAESLLPSFRQRLDRQVHITHDLGFLYTLSARAQYQLTGDETARQLALRAAGLLAKRYNAAGRYLQAWGDLTHPVERGRTIIDSMMNVPLLFWASREENREDYYTHAANHLDTLRQYLIREDGSSYHAYFFNPDTGDPLYPKTVQGYSDHSLWSRGQAWTIYGCAVASEWCPEQDYLSTAKKAARRFIDELPPDGIPWWDLRLPPHAPHHRDTSAGAVAAAGMVRIACLSEGEEAEFWRQQAETMFITLTIHCLDTHPEAEGFLRQGAAHVPDGWGIGGYLIYGDYFYLEGLQFLLGRGPDFWGNGTLERRLNLSAVPAVGKSEHP